MERNYSKRLEAEIYKNFFGLKSNISLMDSNTQIAYEYQWKEKLML